jgi:hypothetical protein
LRVLIAARGSATNGTVHSREHFRSLNRSFGLVSPLLDVRLPSGGSHAAASRTLARFMFIAIATN